jgi:hypothetical protein
VSGGDKWDGTGPGDELSDPDDLDATGAASTPAGGPAGTSPGGAASLLEEGTANYYLRVQDTGNPLAHGWTQGGDPENHNRRVYFGHNMQQDGTLVGNEEQLVIDTGMTVSFRARIANSGPLDDIYLENFALAADFDEDVDVDVGGTDFLTWQLDPVSAFEMSNARFRLVRAACESATNRNPFPIEVRITSAGDVTHWTETQHASEPLALDGGFHTGQTFTLNPGDRVTLNYHDPPAWIWKGIG